MNKIIPVLIILFVVSMTPAFSERLLAVDPDNERTQNPLFIKDTQTSSFTLEKTTRLGVSHYYSFNGKAGDTIFMQVNVPDEEPYRDFRPSFDILLGNEKTIAIPTSERFHDNLYDEDWLTTAKLTVLLEKDGKYLIRVHDELSHYEFGNVGKFSFVIGFEENLTIFDWIQFPLWYGQVKLFFGEIMLVIIMLLILFSALMITWYVVSNRKR